MALGLRLGAAAAAAATATATAPAAAAAAAAAAAMVVGRVVATALLLLLPPRLRLPLLPSRLGQLASCLLPDRAARVKARGGGKVVARRGVVAAALLELPSTQVGLRIGRIEHDG
eukprot:1591082-Prymnesium_polylepis.1